MIWQEGQRGAIVRGRRLFRYFLQRGAIIRGDMSKNENMFSKTKTKQNDHEKSEKEIISARVEPQTFDV